MKHKVLLSKDDIEHLIREHVRTLISEKLSMRSCTLEWDATNNLDNPDKPYIQGVTVAVFSDAKP